MTTLILAAAFFLGLHLLVSGTPVRAGLVRMMGERAYMGLFSLASLAGIVWLVSAYGQARFDPANAVWWSTELFTRHAAALVQLVAVFFVVAGLLTPNPTSVMQEKAVSNPATGMLRITRHPFLWGVALWSAGHLLVNGDQASLLLFGSLLVLAVIGTFSIDAKRAKALGPAWEPFRASTSNLPFAAILTGRTALRVEEIGWWRALAALAAFALLLVGHETLFGVSPLR
ncbi:MAG TPA: NnrU family protein [Caulobacteraceae bacterium]|nr:NnrU family protein [Caulobacteraceae bacterium]